MKKTVNAHLCLFVALYFSFWVVSGESGLCGEFQLNPVSKKLRKELLDTVRPDFEAALNVEVLFVVEVVNVVDNWAFLVVSPVRKIDQGKIDLRKADKWLRDQSDFIDGDLLSPVLLKKTKGAWKVMNFEIGPTDVAWLPWSKSYGTPERLFNRSD